MTENIKPTRKHVNRIFEWCIQNYGKSKFNKELPQIQYRKEDYYTEGCMAYYDELDAIIYVNKEKNQDLKELVNSIIHEYIHYKQNMKHYQILSLYHTDRDNPLEIEARKIANRDTKKCIKELFTKEANITTN